MAVRDTASARTVIITAEEAELARRRDNADPNALSVAEMHGLPGSGPLVLDGMRDRPRYFDGRFLTAADLTRDQDYVSQRQADLARATGTGVVEGLRVRILGGDTLIIEAGHGITPAGDLVIISSEREIRIADLPATQRLDAQLGLRLEPAQPLTRRTGLFILALRPVEFTANQISAYPTTLTGPRTIEDGDIIEATAVTLVPYPETGGAGSLDDMRRAVSRIIFVEGNTNGQPQDALPLAMLALDRGTIRWIDVAMVRRETGADTPLQVALGAKPRALAEAHVLQYAQHLADVLEDRKGRPFSAAEAFGALPAAGRLPLAAISYDNIGFLQGFFPALVDVEISFVASDEIAALVEESQALPPIDLMGDPADLDAAGAVVLVPVKRDVLSRLLAGFGKPSLPARNQDAGLGLRRAPMAMLERMILRRPPVALVPAPAPAPNAILGPTAEQWKSAWELAKANMEDQRDGQPQLLWYVRRRTIAHQSRLDGVPVNIHAATSEFVEWRDAHLKELDLSERFSAALNRTKEPARSLMTRLFGSPGLLRSSALFASALLRVEAIQPADRDISAAAIEDIATDFSAPDLGVGFARLFGTVGMPEFQARSSLWLAEKGNALEVDRKLGTSSSEKFSDIAHKIYEVIESDARDADKLNELLAAI